MNTNIPVHKLKKQNDRQFSVPEQFDSILFVNSKTKKNSSVASPKKQTMNYTLHAPIPERKTIDEIRLGSNKATDYNPNAVDLNGFPILKAKDVATIKANNVGSFPY